MGTLYKILQPQWMCIRPASEVLCIFLRSMRIQKPRFATNEDRGNKYGKEQNLLSVGSRIGLSADGDLLLPCPILISYFDRSCGYCP